MKKQPAITTLYREETTWSFDFTHSQEEANQFIATRTNAIESALENHTIIRIIGKTGAGKTYSIDHLGP